MFVFFDSTKHSSIRTASKTMWGPTLASEKARESVLPRTARRLSPELPAENLSHYL